MKAITIHEPYATLIGLEEKRFETRGWRTHYRGPIAIHAAKRVDKNAIHRLGNLLPDLFQEINLDYDEWPSGAIVATANLVNCYEIYEDAFGDFALMKGKCPHWMIPKNSKEHLLGYYATGRFAWELTDVKMLDEPIPAKGQQGLWNWEAGA